MELAEVGGYWNTSLLLLFLGVEDCLGRISAGRLGFDDLLFVEEGEMNWTRLLLVWIFWMVCIMLEGIAIICIGVCTCTQNYMIYILLRLMSFMNNQIQEFALICLFVVPVHTQLNIHYTQYFVQHTVLL